MYDGKHPLDHEKNCDEEYKPVIEALVVPFRKSLGGWNGRRTG
jgi:hypothetical protein